MNARSAIALDLALPQEIDERTTIEKEEDWVYFHLTLARGCRVRLMHMELASAEYGDEVANRRAAITSAMKHAELLRRMDSQIPPFLDSLMRAEGL